MGNFSVLIVDSNSYYIDLFKGYLERTQLFSRYDIASDGKEALEKVYTNRPDLLIIIFWFRVGFVALRLPIRSHRLFHPVMEFILRTGLIAVNM